MEIYRQGHHKPETSLLTISWRTCSALNGTQNGSFIEKLDTPAVNHDKLERNYSIKNSKLESGKVLLYRLMTLVRNILMFETEQQ